MDYNNDQEWQYYYSSMMFENSPAFFSRQSLSPRYDLDGRDVSYEDEERGDAEEDRVDNYEEEGTPTSGDGALSPSGDDIRESCTKKTKKTKTKTKRKRRDPNKPKGCLTAVLLYSNANRARVKVENPGMKFGDVVSCFWRPT
jgi:hypothetical protein